MKLLVSKFWNLKQVKLLQDDSIQHHSQLKAHNYSTGISNIAKISSAAKISNIVKISNVVKISNIASSRSKS